MIKMTKLAIPIKKLLYNFLQDKLILTKMLTIRSMQILYREAALMESIITHKTKIRLEINGQYSYESTEVPVKEKLAMWPDDPIYVTELPKGMNVFNLEFFFYKNGQQVGKAKCKVALGRNRKDCLDIANRAFQIVGKFLFQTIWNVGSSQQMSYSNTKLYAKEKLKSQDQNQYQYYPDLNDYSQPMPMKKINTQPSYDLNRSQNNPYLNEKSASTSYYQPPNLNKPYFKNVQKSSQIETKPKKSTGFLGSLGGCFGCYGVMRIKKKKPFFVTEPLVIDLNSLPYASPAQQEPFSIQYYSKPLPQPQKS